VAQVSKPAVSPISKSALGSSAGHFCRLLAKRRPRVFRQMADGAFAFGGARGLPDVASRADGLCG